MSRARAFAALLALARPGPAPAAPPPLGPADRASAETLLAALIADPFAEAPLHSLERIYDRGPGRPALVADLRRRAGVGVQGVAARVVMGRIELGRNRRAEGIRALDEAVPLTRDPVILRRIALLLDSTGAGPEAIRAYQAGLAGASPIELRGMQLRLGALLLAQNKIGEARAIWDAAKRSAPADQALRRQIAEALATRGAWREAIAELVELEPLVTREPTVLVALLRREADLARRANDRALGGDKLLRAYGVAAGLDQVPLRAELTLELLRIYKADRSATPAVRKRGVDELVAVARKRAAAEPALAALIGDALAARDETAAAIEALHRARAARPKDPYVLRRLAALETGEDRIRALEGLYDVDRADAAIGLELTAALYAAKRPDDAVRQARSLRSRFPDNPLVLSELGRLLSQNAEHAEVLVVLERVLALDPNHPDAAIAYGDALAALGRNDEAERVYFRLVARDGSPTSYRHLIEILLKRRRSREVKRAYGEALARTPEDHALRRDYARWLAAAGSLDEALAEWKRIGAQARDPLLRDFAAREIQRIEHQKLFNR